MAVAVSGKRSRPADETILSPATLSSIVLVAALAPAGSFARRRREIPAILIP
jgi:hypothetical protein